MLYLSSDYTPAGRQVGIKRILVFSQAKNISSRARLQRVLLRISTLPIIPAFVFLSFQQPAQISILLSDVRCLRVKFRELSIL